MTCRQQLKDLCEICVLIIFRICYLKLKAKQSIVSFSVCIVPRQSAQIHLVFFSFLAFFKTTQNSFFMFRIWVWGWWWQTEVAWIGALGTVTSVQWCHASISLVTMQTTIQLYNFIAWWKSSRDSNIVQLSDIAHLINKPDGPQFLLIVFFPCFYFFLNSRKQYDSHESFDSKAQRKLYAETENEKFLFENQFCWCKFALPCSSTFNFLNLTNFSLLAVHSRKKGKTFVFILQLKHHQHTDNAELQTKLNKQCRISNIHPETLNQHRYKIHFREEKYTKKSKRNLVNWQLTETFHRHHRKQKKKKKTIVWWKPSVVSPFSIEIKKKKTVNANNCDNSNFINSCSFVLVRWQCEIWEWAQLHAAAADVVRLITKLGSFVFLFFILALFDEVATLP